MEKSYREAREYQNFSVHPLTDAAPNDTFAQVRKRVVVVDNYDSFTFNLVQYLEELGARCDVRLHDRTTVDEIQLERPDGVLLSPGPGEPGDAGITLAVVAALSGKIPLLGVCLGHQAIGEHFGATVRRAARPTHGKASAIAHGGTGIYRGIPSPFAGARYHSLSLEPRTLPDSLEPTATSPDGELMGVRHRHFPVEGVQFHPESILSEHGKTLLANWLEAL